MVIDSARRVINTSDYGDNYSTSLCPGEHPRRKSHLHGSCYASDDRVNKKGRRYSAGMRCSRSKKGNEIDRSVTHIDV